MLRMAQEALTFDDVLLVPGFSDVLPKDVSLKTRLTRNLFLNIPLLSAAMDTVTEARLAIAMAQEGGIGIIHKNMTMAQQAAEVRKVKKHESVIVKDPVTVSPKAKLEDLLAMARPNTAQIESHRLIAQFNRHGHAISPRSLHVGVCLCQEHHTHARASHTQEHRTCHQPSTIIYTYICIERERGRE